AAAATGVRVLAGRGHPVGRCLADLHRVGPGELGRDLGHAGHDTLTGQRVAHEHHRKALGPGDAPAALRDVLDGHLDVLAYLIRAVARLGWGGRADRRRWP